MDPLILITIILASATMLGLAICMSMILGWANVAFHVEVDPKVEAVNKVLPGANCGGCGYVGCNEFAEAVAQGKAPCDGCPVGGATCAAEVAAVMGVEVGESIAKKAIVHCNATCTELLQTTPYKGEMTCASAKVVSGLSGCVFGCIGLSDCVRVCDFDAIHVTDNLAKVDYDKCVGCNACIKACPQDIISLENFVSEDIPSVLCSSQDPGPVVKKVCKVGCTGCKLCTKKSDLFVMNENLAVFNVAEYKPGEKTNDILDAMEKCPSKIIHWAGPGREIPERQQEEPSENKTE